MAVSVDLDLLLSITEVGSGDLGLPKKPHIQGAGGIGAGNRKVTYATGTAANQQDLVYSDEITLAATPTSLDLAGVLADAFGTTITFVEVTGFLIRNASTTTGENINIGGNANAFVNWISAAVAENILGPGGTFLITSPVDGYGVTAGTGDILDLDPGAATITCQVVIWGRSA